MIDLKKRDQVMTELIGMPSPKVSIYMPTHLAFPENKQDPILYKNLVQQAEAMLAASQPRRQWEHTIAALNRLLDDPALWIHTSEGLAVLAAGSRVETFHLETTTQVRVEVGDSFHLLPVYPLLDSIGQAYLIDIAQDRFKAWHVSRDGLAEVHLQGIKRSFQELFDDLDSQRHMNTGSQAGESGGYHGYSDKESQVDKDVEKYLRYLDDAFSRQHKLDGLPMILAGTESSQAAFRRLAKGSFYLQGSISKPVDAMSRNSILQELHRILAPHMEKSLGSRRTIISNKRSEGKVLSQPQDIAAAAQEGRVEVLIVDGAPRESVAKLMDQAAEQVLHFGGRLSYDSEGLLGLPERQLALLR